MRHASLLALATTAALGGALGCASAPVNSDTSQTRQKLLGPDQSAVMDVDVRSRDVRNTVAVAMPPVQAFDALPAAYEKLGIKTVAVVDTSGGMYTIGARYLRLHGSLGGTRLSRYLDCGSAPMHNPADSYDVVFSATTYVAPAATGSTVNTLVTADARDPASNTPPVRCTSTGVFEQSIAKLVSGS